ncbi:uncharacterized protein I206_102160 [Kwoniella pini CBS 10737]|uniref:Uncharacterized protein n=1 Tax=Kwoniella pini CBS 10737 TaxID=1296096 RepID=A0A1B9HUM7_9TREE|nr:uncharacterized protein I206_06745 [Kwoniella pini CBS 10737]OCF46971.1 hypothetical protein I206_06745 [Kwoniella pini CBS 10737]
MDSSNVPFTRTLPSGFTLDELHYQQSDPEMLSRFQKAYPELYSHLVETYIDWREDPNDYITLLAKSRVVREEAIKSLESMTKRAQASARFLDMQTAFRGFKDTIQSIINNIDRTEYNQSEAWRKTRITLEGFKDSNYTKSSTASEDDLQIVKHNLLSLTEDEKYLLESIIKNRDPREAFNRMKSIYLQQINPTDASIFCKNPEKPDEHLLDGERRSQMIRFSDICQSQVETQNTKLVEGAINRSRSSIDYLITEKGSLYPEILVIGHQCRDFFTRVELADLYQKARTAGTKVQQDTVYRKWLDSRRASQDDQSNDHWDHPSSVDPSADPEKLINAIAKGDRDLIESYDKQMASRLIGEISGWNRGNVGSLNDRWLFEGRLHDVRLSLERIHTFRDKYFV